MAALENKADQLISEAEKKIDSFSFFNFFLNKSTKIEQAIECYLRAANLLKVSKNWSKAAACFTKCADLNNSNTNRYDAATNFVDAANCYRKFDPRKAIDVLERAVEILIDIGRFSIAAKHHKTIAEIYENQLYDLKNAVNNYEQASEYFRSEENDASAEVCLLKVAHYSAIFFEDYHKAIEIYQQIAIAHISGTTLLKYNVHAYLFKAALCHLCNDVLSGRIVLLKYLELFPSFEDSNECKFLMELVKCIECDDLNCFIASRFTFCSKFGADETVKTMLMRIEKILSNGIDL